MNCLNNKTNAEMRIQGWGDPYVGFKTRPFTLTNLRLPTPWSCLHQTIKEVGNRCDLDAVPRRGGSRRLVHVNNLVLDPTFSTDPRPWIPALLRILEYFDDDANVGL